MSTEEKWTPFIMERTREDLLEESLKKIVNLVLDHKDNGASAISGAPEFAAAVGLLNCGEE